MIPEGTVGLTTIPEIFSQICPGSRSAYEGRRARLLHAAVATVLFCLVPLSLRGADASAEAQRRLADVKAATGGEHWDRITTWHERGTFQAGEVTGDYETWVDFRQLRSFTEVRHTGAALGAIHQTSGWTGKISWLADETGDVRIDDSEESRSDAIGTAYFAAFGYLFGTRYPAKIQSMGPHILDGNPFDVVQVTPRDSDPVDLWIDRASHRVLRLAPVTGIDKSAAVLSDFRMVEGMTVPFKSVRLGNASDPKQESQIASIEINRTPPAGIFDAPQPRFTDIHFPPDQDSVTLEFRLIDNQIHLPVSLNGQRFEDFNFDTGGGNLVATNQARSLGLKIEIAAVGYGAGPDSVVSGIAKVDRLEVGGLRLDQQLFSTLDSKSAGGVIGYQIAKRTVVVMDYMRHQITFMKPAAFRPPAQAVAMPFRFAGQMVLVEATVDGHRGDFIIDTGSTFSLLIHRPFAEQHGLIEKHHAVHELAAYGLGGSWAPIRLFRPDQFSIGPLHPPAPVGGIFLSETGVGATEHVAGNIGNGILKRFTMTLDYAHRMIYFEPNRSFQDPDVNSVGWSGLRVSRNASSGRLEVIESEHNSPAAEAGILKGDGLLAINGSSLEGYTVEQLDKALNAAPGTVLALTIQRGSDTHEVKITTGI